ncbi:MAG: hypothetical protein RIR18_1513 [Pseudomonadota bacterium]|jgi:CRISPR-associated protein (TIGR02584 family)
MTEKRRVLLAVTGLSPQIVTETLYALAVARETPWVPDEIRVVTTIEGAERAKLTLLEPDTGHFHALCRDYGLSGKILFNAEQIQVIRNAEGLPLSDIRTPEDNTLAADALLAEVRSLCADEHTELHVSIAGGRKTMGFFLGYALSLFGRVQDRLSHVLVNDPFESLTDFYYPPATPKVLYTRDGRPMHTSAAKVMLAEIPFVRLRDGLPKEALSHGSPFAALVSTAQQMVAPSGLRFDLANRLVWCGKQAVKLPPANLAWYAFLAKCRIDGLGDEGFVRFSDVDPSTYLAIYGRIVGRSHDKFLATQQAMKNGFEPSLFEQRKSKINRELSTELSLASSPYLIVCRGDKPRMRYGINLDSGAIKITI